MNLDESMAYALATWARFDEAITDDLLRAVCGAFAIVAAADRGGAQFGMMKCRRCISRKRSIVFARAL